MVLLVACLFVTVLHVMYIAFSHAPGAPREMEKTSALSCWGHLELTAAAHLRML